MRKLCRILSILLALALLLSACQSSLSARMEQEVTDALKAQADFEGFIDYYGTFNGYVVVNAAGVLAVITSIEVAGYRFTYGSGAFKIYAYKDGVVYELGDAYEKGLLSKFQIGRIYDRHVEMYSYLYTE